jgi:hypothetical protein
MPLRRKVGRLLIVSGLLTIFVSVIYVLEDANGPGTGPKTFAQRRSYNQVKESVQSTFPIAFLFAIGGLGLTMAGARLARPENSNP